MVTLSPKVVLRLLLLFVFRFFVGKTDVLGERNMGETTNPYIKVKLNITNTTTDVPIYYVNVRAENGAGALSNITTSRLNVIYY